MVEKLTKSGLPIYLYGTGELAEEFFKRFIAPNNIAITGVIISKQYYKEGSAFFGHSVQPLEDILNENLKANVILCFLKDNYDDVIANLKKIAPNCNFLITQKMFLEDLQGKIEAVNR